MIQRIIFFLFFVKFSLCAYSQGSKFIYLQADNKQTFQVKMMNKVYSASSSGYLLLSKLKSDSVQFIISFPNSKTTEQNFIISLAGINNAGYLIKDFNEKGWGLYNIQTLQIIYASNAEIQKPREENANKIVRKDAFGDMLENVTKDSTVNEIAINEPQKETKLIETISSKKDTINVKPIEPKKVVEVVKKSESIILKPTISKISEQRSSTGLNMIFVDQDNNKTDTINVFIDAVEEKPIALNENINSESKEKSISTVKNDTSKISLSNQNARTEGVSISEFKKDTSGIKVTVSNTNCKKMATDDDFMRLRNAMTAFKNDDDMIAAAKKVFKVKCFTSTQIKNLAYLFLTDEGKYHFLDTAYPYVSDKERFKDLSSLLFDSYYIKRFEAMLRNE